MTYTRKHFLSAAASGLAMTLLSGKLQGKNFNSSAKENLHEFGLQLWTIRDVLQKDPRGVLRQVASMGYQQLESFEGDSGMFWGMKNTEFKKLMDDLGMKLIASHCNIDNNFERKAAEAAEIGMKYLIDPWYGPQKNIDLFKKAAEKFNDRGLICKKAGLRYGYHNHDYPFVAVDGEIPLEVMIKNTDPELVDFEMDIYWVVTAGEDPVKWFETYPGRFRLCHVKDRKKGVPLSEKSVSCVVGQGEINFTKILKTGQQYGLEYFIIEQEQFEGMTTLAAAKADADYFRKNLLKSL